jgi:hypothetical protein
MALSPAVVVIISQRISMVTCFAAVAKGATRQISHPDSPSAIAAADIRPIIQGSSDPGWIAARLSCHPLNS